MKISQRNKLIKYFLIALMAIFSYLIILRWDRYFVEVPKSNNIELKDSAENDSANFAIDSKSNSENYITVSNDVYQVKINLLGGDIDQVSLKDYTDNKNDNLRLLDKTNKFTYIAQSGIIGADGFDNNNKRAKFKAEQKSYKITSKQQNVILTFANDKLSVKKIFSFSKNSYEIKQSYEITNLKATTLNFNLFAQIKRDYSADPEISSTGLGGTAYLGAAVSSVKDKYNKISFSKIKEKNYRQQVDSGWIAMVQQYFVSAWILPDNMESLLYTQNINNNFAIVGYKTDNFNLLPNQTKVLEIKFYAGPKIKQNLNQVANNLSLTIDYGWLWFISEILVDIMIFIHSIVGNWGWSIVLLTCVVKLAMFPLTHTSFKAMAKMKKLAPEMKLIKERVGNNRESIAKETMALYKKHKVNPMSGCFPILLQMPVFISLYWGLRESIFLRHAPFILWIKDLSQIDPYFIFPLLMGLTMYIQQSFNPSPSTDPTQAKIFKMMPLIFTVMFLWFPAGLTIYWVTNNTLSIIQQYLINRSLNK